MVGLVLGTIVFFADLYFLVKEDMGWYKATKIYHKIVLYL